MKCTKISPVIWTVIGVSLIGALTNSVRFFLATADQPPDSVYLGTVHYWEDYFLYLNHFFQGAHGAWLTVNRYTPVPTPDSIIYWSNVMLGKVTGLLGMPPILGYNVSVIVLTSLTLALSYLVLRRVFGLTPVMSLIGFLTGNTATSMINRVQSREGGMIFWPFQIWRTPHFAFDRLGGAPHQLMQTSLSYLFFIIYFSPANPDRKSGVRKLILLGLTGVALTTLNPVQAGFYLGLLWVTAAVTAVFRKNRPDTGKLLAVSAAVTGTFLYTSDILNSLPHIQSRIWEASQHSFTIPGFLILSIGPILLLSIPGIIRRWKNFTPPEVFGLLVIAAGYGLFLSRIPQKIGVSNLRFLLPASYVIWGAFAAWGVDAIVRKLKSAGVPKRSYLTGFVLIVYFALTMPTIIWEISQKLPTAGDRTDPMIYLPRQVSDGFDYLARRTDFNSIVLANPSRHMDTLVPALSGHTAYSGHMLATVDNAGNQKQATRFFTGQTPEGAGWLRSQQITYVLYTVYDGNRAEFERSYPFLKKIFENTGTAVYEL
ncbi:hypothetical protein A2Z33_04165 [Candidatus Gottesmanbacteria bacterium RBG_16_52_11]|uniref:Glycosyltransferase RgtA/B/C/D-like domain-containing protein n=1 Tax=Candidatus Gottesmanbacteria bacterium RBG_16_52_11 TaxID=1798374 RepID=A0A1F5YW17_9BACT|nr:MAG: hypothetical protein A2Z33_04165 [Candidatus Gottesmanbacteria bacterium RBG_16_52_11]